FDWARLLHFLAARAIPHVETVHEAVYFRTVRVRRRQQDYVGFIQVSHEPERRTITVRLSESLLPVCAVVLERVKQLFDLHAEPALIAAVLGDIAATRPGLRVPGTFDGFELAVRAILGQQISVAGARTIAGRLAVRFGTPLATQVKTLTHLFP